MYPMSIPEWLETCILRKWQLKVQLNYTLITCAFPYIINGTGEITSVVWVHTLHGHIKSAQSC